MLAFCITVSPRIPNQLYSQLSCVYQVLEEEGGGRSTMNNDIREFRERVRTAYDDVMDKVAKAKRKIKTKEEEDLATLGPIEDERSAVAPEVIKHAQLQAELLHDVFGKLRPDCKIVQRLQR